jgi:hypothetical protein
MALPQILLFQTTDPATVKKRLLRFREAFLRLGAECDFAIVSFKAGAETEVRKVVLDGVQIDHHVFGISAVNALDYPKKAASRPFKLIPGNCDLIALLFRKAAPHYGQYWVIEDDVDYSGDVHDLFAGLYSRPGAMLATHLARGYEGWAYSSMLRSPNGDVKAADTWLVFLTFFRISGPALDTIDRYYKNGWSGHSENMWATILKHAGMDVIDIGGNGRYVSDEDRNQRYYGLPDSGFEKDGSFGTMNIRLFMGRRKNVLWHPIKPFKVWMRQNTKRLISIGKWHLGKLGFSLHQHESRSDIGAGL